MQKMEKFYGFKVTVESELDPIRIEVLKENANKIMSAYNFNPEEYFVYFHQLSIKSKKEYFGVKGGLSKRLKRVELMFSVNMKQRRMDRIKFFNFLLDKPAEEQVKMVSSADQVTYLMDGEYLEKNLGFRNEIVTFISKQVRSDHRKIKISVIAFPTDEYVSSFHRQKDRHITQLDFKFKKSISLITPQKNFSQSNPAIPPNLNEKEGTIIMGDVYHNYGQTASMGKKASATKIKNEQIINSDNIEDIKDQLEKLRIEMRVHAKTMDDDLAIVKIGKAVEAAEQNDAKGIINHLKNIGSKSINIAEKIGVSLLTALLKQSSGL